MITAEEFLNSKEFELDEGINFEDYYGDSISGITINAMEKYTKLYAYIVKQAYEQYLFFANGYKNGSASISEVNHAHDEFIKLLEI